MENKFWVSLKVNLGDYTTADYGGAGMTAQEAKENMKAMMLEIPPEKLKETALRAKEKAMSVEEKFNSSVDKL